MGIDDDAETEEALAEFDFLVQESEDGAGEARSHGDGPDWGKATTSLTDCCFVPPAVSVELYIVCLNLLFAHCLDWILWFERLLHINVSFEDHNYL